jgi:uncharacterized lipoprotein
MKKIISIIFLVMLLVGCAARQPMTQAERDRFDKIRAYPTTFTLPNEQSEEAWARAQSFIAQYSNMKIQIATQYLLQTYNPTGAIPTYGYNVSRMPSGDKTQFTVQCISGNRFAGKEAQQNAATLSYYMATGDLESRMIHR